MDYIYEDPPCGINEVINLNFSFENLQKFLNFLSLNNKDFFTKISNIFIKLKEIDDLKTELNDTNFRLNLFEGKFNDYDITLKNIKDKLLELENKSIISENKIIVIEDDQRMSNIRLSNHDDQLMVIQRTSDENTRSLNKLFDVNDKIRNTNESLIERNNNCEKSILKINNELYKITDIENNLKLNITKVEESTKHANDIQYYTNQKFSDLDAEILNLITNFNEVSSNISNNNYDKKQMVKMSSQINQNNNQNNNQNYNQNYNQNFNQNINPNVNQNNNQNSVNPVIREQLNKANTDIENINKLNIELSGKLEKLTQNTTLNTDSLKDLIAKIDDNNLKADILKNNISETITDQNKLSENFEEFKINFFEKRNQEINSKISELTQSIESINEQILKLHETLKNISNSSSGKASKEDIDKVSRQVHTEIEKIMSKVSEQFKLFDGRMKSSQTGLVNNTETNNINPFFSKKTINFDDEFEEMEDHILKIVKTLLDTELTKKMTEFFDLENGHFKEFLVKIEENKLDIDYLKLELLDVKTSITDNPTYSFIVKKISDFSSKLFDFDSNYNKNFNEIENKFKEILGENIIIDEDDIQHIEYENHHDTTRNPLTVYSIKEIIKLLLLKAKKNNEALIKVNHKQDNMNLDILNKVKKDLSHESTRILEDFKVDLKSSINRIEDQLREKVDRFSLDEFGKRVDNKLTHEFNKKIDKSDLKKNNNLINKKIDTLENKISKTLVDTLIDMQMDDAPLIIKKSINGEKCASCNQNVQERLLTNNGYQPINTGSFHNHQEDDIKHYSTQTKFKLRNIQDSSNKYGTGSYSRFLGNSENMNDELKPKNIHLPDIPYSKGMKKNMVLSNSTNNLNPLVTTKSNIRIDDYTEKQFNNKINEELEKKIINPENLIKTANKFFENVEKRNAANK